ncbi:MAG: glycosyltransferase, partial [Actinomycetota bacterium]
VARERFSLQPEDQVLVVVRRLVQRMGHETLFDALEQLRASGRTPTVLLVGSGPERDHLEASSRRRGLDGQVRFLGALSDDDLVLAYGAANCSIIPSVALEGFGLVALESLACATPVIGSDLGGLGAVLRQLDPSLLVAPGDASSLSRAIVRVLDGIDPSPEECRRFALERSWDAIALQHLRLLSPSTPRVLYLGHGAQLSGGELALLRQLPALLSVDAIVVLGEDGPLVGELREKGVDVVVLQMAETLRSTRRANATLAQLGPRKGIDLVRYVLALRKEVKELSPDVLHTNTLKAALLGGVVGRLTRTPVVWHLRDRIDVDYLPAGVVRLVRLCARLLPSAIVGNSAATLATLRGGRVRMVIPSPLDPHATPGERGSGPLTVTMVGRLSPWKGQDLFLQAFALAFPEGPERARIVGEAMFGEESYAASLREMANALGIADRVDFLGFRRDVAQLLQTSDIQIVASRIPEPFGNVVLEGMACGTAVIAPNAGGPAEVLSDGVTGILVTPDDAGALAQAMKMLGDDAALRSRLVTAAMGEVLRYRPERLAPQYSELYDAVLHQGNL